MSNIDNKIILITEPVDILESYITYFMLVVIIVGCFLLAWAIGYDKYMFMALSVLASGGLNIGFIRCFYSDNIKILVVNELGLCVAYKSGFYDFYSWDALQKVEAGYGILKFTTITIYITNKKHNLSDLNDISKNRISQLSTLFGSKKLAQYITDEPSFITAYIIYIMKKIYNRITKGVKSN